MSWKLAGAEYPYDARNVEALTVQMALLNFRTNVLGVPFELYSVHNSLQFLFTQKSPSQQILRLCDFLAEYNFKEIKYVPGPDNVVPDFLSRPWDGAKSHSPFHKLVQSVTPRLSCLHSWQRWVHPSVIVLLSWRGHIALQHRDGAPGLWAVNLTPNETAVQAVRRALCLMLSAQCKQFIMSYMACSGNVDFWRAEFCDKDEMHQPMGAHHAVWTVPTALPCRYQWHLPHFESLPHFGVWCARGTGGVFPSDWGPDG